jgi:hypothetical protein
MTQTDESMEDRIRRVWADRHLLLDVGLDEVDSDADEDERERVSGLVTVAEMLARLA